MLDYFQKLQREGEDGRRKINQYTRIGTVLISAMQGWAFSIKLLNTQTGGVGEGDHGRSP